MRLAASKDELQSSTLTRWDSRKCQTKKDLSSSAIVLRSPKMLLTLLVISTESMEFLSHRETLSVLVDPMVTNLIILKNISNCNYYIIFLGNIIIWDKDSKQRTATLDRFEKENTISALTFNPMNNLLFYSLSYDW